MLTMITFMAMMLTQCSAMDKQHNLLVPKETRTKCSTKSKSKWGKVRTVWRVQSATNSFMENLKIIQQKALDEYEKESERMLRRQDCDHDVKTYIEAADGEFDEWLEKGEIEMCNSIFTVSRPFLESYEKMNPIRSTEGFGYKDLLQLVLAYGRDKAKKSFTEVLTNAKKIILDNLGGIALNEVLETQKHNLMGAAKKAWDTAVEDMKSRKLTKKDIYQLIKAHYDDYFSDVRQMWKEFKSHPLKTWKTVKAGWKTIKATGLLGLGVSWLKSKLKHFGKTAQEIIRAQLDCNTSPSTKECPVCYGNGKTGCWRSKCRGCKGSGDLISVSEPIGSFPEITGRRRLINRMLREIRRAQNLA